jgi:hypothetical protein
LISSRIFEKDGSSREMLVLGRWIDKQGREERREKRVRERA